MLPLLCNSCDVILFLRFAQRVALIKNEALVNEELDPRAMITRLKNRVTELKQDLELATGTERTEELIEEEMSACRDAVEIYLAEKELETQIQVSNYVLIVCLCMKWIRPGLITYGAVQTLRNASKRGRG